MDDTTLRGKIAAEVATQARQAGVPCYAIVGQNGMDPFGQRLLDIQDIVEATDIAELEAAGERLGRSL